METFKTSSISHTRGHEASMFWIQLARSTRTRNLKRKEYEAGCPAPALPGTWSSPHVAGRGSPCDHSPHQEAVTADPGHPCGDKYSSLCLCSMDIIPTIFRVWNVDTRVMMVGHIPTVVFLIDDDRDEARDDTGRTVENLCWSLGRLSGFLEIWHNLS